MAKYNISRQERWAVFIAHNRSCYLCEEPISFTSMHVDHIIPETLLNQNTLLATTIDSFGLERDFDLNSFENWLPACGPCNMRKAATVFKPVPVILIRLKKAKKEANKARKIVAQIVSDRDIDGALETLWKAMNADQLPLEALQPLIKQFLGSNRQAFHAMIAGIEEDGSTIGFLTTDGGETSGLIDLWLTPFYKVLFHWNGKEIVQTPHGVGYRPVGTNLDRSFYCGSCGSLGPWSGARCLSCGYLDDGDGD